MNLPLPDSFYAELSPDRLRLIAEALLDVRYETLRQMSTELDDGYTRETAVFGRSRNRLIELAQRGDTTWLTLAHAGMDVTFNIGSVPCRFFRDDPESPEKGGFFRRNAVDSLFAVEDKMPVMWRFIVERAMSDDGEDRVVFAGYNAYQEKVSEWVYDSASLPLHSVGTDVPPATILPAATVDIREESATNVSQKRKLAPGSE
jgi:hypothetical protein